MPSGAYNENAYENAVLEVLRLAGRGLADSGETLTVRVLPDSLFMIMR